MTLAVQIHGCLASHTSDETTPCRVCIGSVVPSQCLPCARRVGRNKQQECLSCRQHGAVQFFSAPRQLGTLKSLLLQSTCVGAASSLEANWMANSRMASSRIPAGSSAVSGSTVRGSSAVSIVCAYSRSPSTRSLYTNLACCRWTD